QVDEVPVQPGVFNPVGELFGVLLPHPRARAEEVRHHHHPADDVQAVQTGQGEVDRQERAVRRPFAACQMVGVLEVLVDQEDSGEQEGGEQIQAVCCDIV